MELVQCLYDELEAKGHLKVGRLQRMPVFQE